MDVEETMEMSSGRAGPAWRWISAGEGSEACAIDVNERQMKRKVCLMSELAGDQGGVQTKP